MAKKEKEKELSVVDEIRASIKNPQSAGGGMPARQAFIPKDKLRRFRWLSDYDEVVKVKMHDKWKVIFPQPCLTYYGKKCPFCKADFKTYTAYVWSVWGYDDEEKGNEGRKRILISKAAPNSIAEGLLEYFDENGTIKDRDYTVERLGERQLTRYRVRPATKNPEDFDPPEGAKIKPFSKDKVFEILSERLIETVPGRADEDDDVNNGGDEGDDDE